MKRFSIDADTMSAYVCGTGSDFLPSFRELRERHPTWRFTWIDPM